jgi:hypothetical protein
MAINFPSNPTLNQTYTQLSGLHIENSVVRNEVDYVKFTVGSTPITALYLTSYQSIDNISFFAIQQGNSWTAGQDVNQMLLYSHFGPNVPGYTVGSNILSPQNVTLQANTTYTMWIQQTGTNITSYTFSTNQSYIGSPSTAIDYSSNPADPTPLFFVNSSATWEWNGVTWSLKPNNSPTFSSISSGSAAISGALSAGSVSTPGINTNTVNASGNITALRFIGDGSQLTNLPLGTGSPGRVAYYNAQGVTAGTSAALTWNDSTGTMTVQNLTVSGSLNASITITSLGFSQGVTIDEFSSDGTFADDSDTAVPTERATKRYVDTQIGLLDLSASGTVNSGVANRLAFYASTGTAVEDTSSDLVWNPVTNKLTVSNAEVTELFSTVSNATIGDSLAVYNDITVGNDLTVNGRLRVKTLFDDTTGAVKFTSGSDFIIDAPGEVNVSGSKIVNVASPTDSTDAVNKAYVDAASSQFAGGPVPNAIQIQATTASSSTTTGALTVGGGIGVGGDGYFGGTIYVAGSPVLTSASGSYNGGTITGALIINNVTQSTSTTTGALRVTGGAGVQGNLNVGGTFKSGGIAFGAGGQNYDTNVAIGGGSGVNAPLGSNIGGQNNIAIGYSNQGQLTTTNNNVSIGYNSMGAKTGGGSNVAIGTDTLSVNEGSTNVAVGIFAQSVGASGDHNTSVGYESLKNVTGIQNTTLGSGAGSEITSGNYNVVIGTNNGSTIATANNNIILSDGQANIRAQWNSSGTLSHGGAINISNATASTSITSGALTVAGGVGVSGDLYASNYYGDGSNLTNIVAQSFAGGTVAGLTNFSNTATSTSTNTGALTVTGGVGIGGAVNMGNTLTVSGTVTFNQNSAASSTTTGTLRVTGGVGITGNVYAANYYGNGSTLSGVTATSATQFNGVTQPRYSSSIKSGFNITGGGTITIGASYQVLWSTRFIVISNGRGSDFSTDGYFDINCPTSGTITGVGGAANRTATASGIPLNAWEALYYILPVGGGAGSVAGNFRVSTYTGNVGIPHNWVQIAIRSGDNNVVYLPNGIKLLVNQSIAAINDTQNRQLVSLGVGTAPSGTAGEIRATNEITAYYSSDRNLKENITPIENALGKLRQITGVMFDWTDEEVERRGGEDDYFVRKHDTGVIAQDVEVVLPEVVATRPDGHKAVKYEKMAGLIIQAINELADQVDEIKKKLG